MFAESSLSNTSRMGASASTRTAAQKHKQYRIANQVQSTSREQAQQEVIRQKVLPWVHALYLFVDSRSELADAIDFLQRPRPRLTVGEHPLHCHMRTVVVLTDNAPDRNGLKAQEILDLFNASMEGIPATILDLRSRSHLSGKVAFEPLRCLVLDQLQSTELRRDAPSFSAHHFEALWNHGARSASSNLDCLSVARARFPNMTALRECLVELNEQAAGVGSPASTLHEFIASALLMDAYPPGSHRT